MDRNDFFRKVLSEKDYTLGLELGVHKGIFAKHILTTWPGTLLLVDVWRKLDKEQYDDILNDPDSLYTCVENIKGFEDRALMLRMSSRSAADLISDNSLDFIYIDANHKYDHVVEDLKLWWPKLKSGGLFSGHDYINMPWDDSFLFEPNGKDKRLFMKGGSYSTFGVNPAVDEFFESRNLEVRFTDEFFSSWYHFKD